MDGEIDEEFSNDSDLNLIPSAAPAWGGPIASDCHGRQRLIRPDFVQYVEPQWRPLCKPELLKKCQLGATQNANESFNNLVWARAPKTEYVNLETVQSQATIVFNSGRQALVRLMDKLGISAGPLCTTQFATQDKDRLIRSQAKFDEVAKKRRQTIQRRDALADQQHQAEEGVTYEAGGF